MNAAQHHVLNWKRSLFHAARPTIDPEANVQVAGNKPWQVIAPGGLDQIAFPANGANAVVLREFKIPAGQSGALTGLVTAAVGSNFVDNSGLAVWHLTLNGRAVPGFENILTALGSFGNPLGTYVLLQENDLLQLWIAGPIYNTGPGLPAPPTGFASGLLTGYICYGGQGTYYNPRAEQHTHRRHGQNLHYTGSDNGRAPNSGVNGTSFNRQR